jgi:hypothetical protein
VQGDADLFQMIGALRSSSRLACHLHGRNKQRRENDNDPDDHEHLD